MAGVGANVDFVTLYDNFTEMLMQHLEDPALCKRGQRGPSVDGGRIELIHRRDGTAVLTMVVRGTEELKAWILSLSPYVEVIRPRELREAVGRQLAEAARLHAEGHRAAVT